MYELCVIGKNYTPTGCLIASMLPFPKCCLDIKEQRVCGEKRKSKTWYEF